MVKTAIEKETGEKVVIKIYEKYRLLDKQKMKNVYREIKVLSHVDHPNIIKLLHTIDTKNQIILVMEYFSEKTMFKYLKMSQTRKVSENSGRIIFKQILSAIAYLHSKNIAHRDIKLENILIGKNK